MGQFLNIGRKRGLVLLGIGLMLSLLVTVYWDRLLLAVATASSDARPALLNDADWNNPSSARAFRERFPPGAPETALMDWLQANHFQIDRRAGRATLKVQSLPCNEDISVSWTLARGTIRDREAVVSEAGCL